MSLSLNKKKLCKNVIYLGIYGLNNGVLIPLLEL